MDLTLPEKKKKNTKGKTSHKINAKPVLNVLRIEITGMQESNK